MIKNETHIDSLKVRKPYVSPQIEVDVYQSEAGFATSETWSHDAMYQLVDDEGDAQIGGGWEE